MPDDVRRPAIETREQPQRIRRELSRRVQPRRPRRPARPTMVEGDDGVVASQQVDDLREPRRPRIPGPGDEQDDRTATARLVCQIDVLEPRSWHSFIRS